MKKLQDKTYRRFFDSLLVAVPEFRPSYEEFIEFYSEFLPHVLMGEFTRFVHEKVQEESKGLADWKPAEDGIIRKVLEFLENALRPGNVAVAELVSVSFLENLEGEEGYERVRPFFGPELLKELTLRRPSEARRPGTSDRGETDQRR